MISFTPNDALQTTSLHDSRSFPSAAPAPSNARPHQVCTLFHARPKNLRTTLSRINSLHGGTTYGYYLQFSLVWIPEHPGGDLHGLYDHSGPAGGRYGYLNYERSKSAPAARPCLETDCSHRPLQRYTSPNRSSASKITIITYPQC